MKQPKNPWNPQDEGDHIPIDLEWWCAEGIFKSIEDGRNWSFKVVFTCGSRRKGNNGFFVTLSDIDNNKHYSYRFYKEPDKFKHEKNKVNVECDESKINGSYPEYSMIIKDKKNNVVLDLHFKSRALPHWVLQDMTNGILPMGFGYYRYGFIPKCELTGTMKINNKKFTVSGLGYLEHVWGNWSYSNPFSTLKDMKIVIPTYFKLIQWWLSENKIKIPKSISFSSENNLLGYDWAWAVFDNGWSLFYGNIMCWISDGPATGVLYLSPDGENYWKFSNIKFHYKELRRSKKYDFYYPSILELTAFSGSKKLRLRFKMQMETHEHVKKYNKGKYWRAFVICEGPGKVDGFFLDENNKVKLKGACRIEPQRQVSVIGHNKLKIDFTIPKKGLGIDADFFSNYFKRKVNLKMHFAPKPYLKLKIKKLK